jgi:hypothetical protein
VRAVPIFKKADAALIALLAALAGALLFSFGAPASRSDGGAVVVRLGGEIYARLPLGQDARLDVALPDGTVANTVRVAGGSAVMERANCPDGLCLRHGAIHSGRDIIVCLPNRVTVEIVGAPSGDIDAAVW